MVDIFNAYKSSTKRVVSIIFVCIISEFHKYGNWLYEATKSQDIPFRVALPIFFNLKETW